MAAEVLSRRALNRALLERQMLLRRVPLPTGPDRAVRVIETVEHLGACRRRRPSRPTTGCGRASTGSARTISPACW